MEFLVQSTLVSSTGMARDSVSNSICVQQNDGDGDEFLFDFAGALWGFYAGTAPGALTNVSALMSPVLSRVADAHTIDVYDITGKLDGTPHGSPVFSLPFSINPTLPASTALPSEVAVCLTIEALGRADEPVERPDGADAGTAVDWRRRRSPSSAASPGPTPTSATPSAWPPSTCSTRSTRSTSVSARSSGPARTHRFARSPPCRSTTRSTSSDGAVRSRRSGRAPRSSGLSWVTSPLTSRHPSSGAGAVGSTESPPHRPRSSSPSSSGSAIESLGRCPSCLGTGARPTTALSVVLPTLSIYVDVLPISRSASSRWKRRALLVLGALVSAGAGSSMWTFVEALW
jgi:hypothetical protein